ncbi:MAG: hypothetical protein KDJ16_10030, partial [Hyphomicrobiales bacterium]|nr:hypothetical protein [Hyphomicrobiales bacterium]
KRAFSGIDLGTNEIETHPDTGAQLVGFQIPNWDTVCRTALDGAAVLHGLGLIGWDIAPSDDGCILVEANYRPDLVLPQLADRRGILEPRLVSFLDRSVAQAKARSKDLKDAYRRELSAGMRRIMKGFGST